MTTQAKHTLGPWAENNNRIVQVTEDGNEGNLICYLPPALSGAREENARLIAAAPALLEALQAIEAALTQPVQFTKIRNGASCDILRYDCAFAVKTARAAIQAATLNQ